MKNKLFNLFIIFSLVTIISFLGISNVKAASCSITARSSKPTVVVGGSVVVTVTISSAASLGAWEFNLNYDLSKLRLTSTNALPHIADYTSSSTKKSVSYTYTFTALASGSTTVSVKNYSVIAFDESYMSASTSGSTIKIMTQAELQASYSSNNFLSSLSVDGSEITPIFNKSITDYSVELLPNTTTVKINANVEDSKASINGIGTLNVVDGDNHFAIKVIAENGNEKTYNLNVTVKELSPIEIKIKNKVYTIVRKSGVIVAPTNYTETTTSIAGEEVLAFTNEITKFTLVGLKDSDGKIDLYIYDNNNETYNIYHEITFNRLILYPSSIDDNIKIPKSYKKTIIKIDDLEIDAWKINKTSNFSLLYGMNVETGKKNLYTYDSNERTLQRYYNDEVKEQAKTTTLYFTMMLVFAGSLIIFLSLIVILILRKNIKFKKLKELK